MIHRLLVSLATSLHHIGAVKFGAFRLKLHETHPDALLSPIFFNLRTADNAKSGPLRAPDIAMISAGFSFLIAHNGIVYDGICGIPNAGTPFADGIKHLTPHPLQSVELSKYEGGEKRRIDGIVNKGGLRHGARVLLIDDVVTGADTKLEAIRVLRDGGFVVENLIVIVDRQQSGGRQAVEAEGVRVHSLFLLTDLLKFYFEKGWISADTDERVRQYIATN